MRHSTQDSLKTCKCEWSWLNALQHFETGTRFRGSLYRPGEMNASSEGARPAGGREHGFVHQWPGRARAPPKGRYPDLCVTREEQGLEATHSCRAGAWSLWPEREPVPGSARPDTPLPFLKTSGPPRLTQERRQGTAKNTVFSEPVLDFSLSGCRTPGRSFYCHIDDCLS